MDNFLLVFIVALFSTFLAFHYCYLFIIQRLRDRILRQNLNVKKVTTSPGGIPMVWISENEFFIDIEVDRNISWKELICTAQINLDDTRAEIEILKLMPKLDIPEKRIERLYFKKLNVNGHLKYKQVIDLFKPDPFALITLLVKEKEFFNKYNSGSIWERKDYKNNPCCLFISNNYLQGYFLARDASMNTILDKYWVVGRKD